MSIRQRPIRGGHDKRTPVVVALISAVAVIIAAIIAAFFQKDSPNAISKSGDTVYAPNSQNVATNVHGSIVGSPGAQIGRKTEFQKQNSLFLQFVHAGSRGGKSEISFATHNRADRFIGEAEVAAFDISSVKPIPIGEPTRFSIGAGEFQPPRGAAFEFSGESPEKLRLCLSFAAADNGSFMTVLMNMQREIGRHNAISYRMSSDYDVFFSKMRGDCNKDFLIKGIPAVEYSGAS